MEKTDRELLIKEISTRLPYGVKVKVYGWDEEKGEVEVPLKVYSINTDGYLSFEYNHYSVETVYVEDCRLCLRPMSSMTEEEKKEYYTFQYKFTLQAYNYQELNKETFSEYLDWLNKNMFDYRGLIPKGLAVDAPNGMYNEQKLL